MFASSVPESRTQDRNYSSPMSLTQILDPEARTIASVKPCPRSADRLYMLERASAWTQPTMDGRQANTGYPDIVPDSPLPHFAIQRSACAIANGATPYPRQMDTAVNSNDN
jgi:hypothetical protein